MWERRLHHVATESISDWDLSPAIDHWSINSVLIHWQIFKAILFDSFFYTNPKIEIDWKEKCKSCTKYDYRAWLPVHAKYATGPPSLSVEHSQIVALFSNLRISAPPPNKKWPRPRIVGRSKSCPLAISSSALCGYPLLKFPEENFFPLPPFSWDPIISDRIFGNRLLPRFPFDIFLRTSWILSTGDGEFATESVAIQISCRKDVNFFGDELNVKS